MLELQPSKLTKDTNSIIPFSAKEAIGISSEQGRKEMTNNEEAAWTKEEPEVELEE
jgi:hypothetical protein